jgi:hypothetical protein
MSKDITYGAEIDTKSSPMRGIGKTHLVRLRLLRYRRYRRQHSMPIEPKLPEHELEVKLDSAFDFLRLLPGLHSDGKKERHPFASSSRSAPASSDFWLALHEDPT